MRRTASRLALLSGILIASSTITCSDNAAGPKSGLRAIVGLAPSLTAAATDVYRNLVSFELLVTNVRVRLERVNGEIALDTTAAVSPGQDSIVLQLSVPLESNQEVLEALIELRDGDLVLFSGTQTVIAKVGFNSSAPPPIELEYSGPGAAAVTLDVDPDTVISASDTLSMRAVARDANNQVVGSSILRWSLNDATMGVMTAAGVFKPSGKRGPVVVTAELPTGVAGFATVSVIPVPTTITLVSGSGQTGIVGASLAQPIVVELRAADGLPVSGRAVTFTASPGGSVLPASAVTDDDGRASAVLTLGTVAGANSLTVTTAGLTPITVGATGTAARATKLVITQQPSASVPAGALLGTQPTVQVQDEFGNAVSAAGIAVTAQLTTGEGRTLAGTTTRSTNPSGAAEFLDLSIAGAIGTATLTFTQDTLASATSSPIAITTGAPGAVTAVTALAMTDTAGANVAAAQLPSVSVMDASNNPVADVSVTFRRRGGTGATINAQADTMVVVATGTDGIASLTSRRLQTVPGVDTVLVTAGSLTDTIRFVATVTHASATQLVFLQPPTAGIATTILSPAITVEVRDQFSNRVTSGPGSTSAVTLNLSGGTTGAQLGPNTQAATQSAVAGVATFNVFVDRVGTDYVLGASAPAPIAGATSSAFSVSEKITLLCAGGAAGSYTTVAEAVAATEAGGVIRVCPGEYAAESVLIDKPLTIEAQGTVKPVIRTVTSLQGLLLRHTTGTVTLRNIAFHNDFSGAVVDGAQVFSYSVRANTTFANITIEDSDFRMLVGGHASGIFAANGGIVNDSRLIVRRSTFVGGRTAIATNGNATLLPPSAVEISHNRFEGQRPNNVTAGNFAVNTAGPNVLLANNVITDCGERCVNIGGAAFQVLNNQITACGSFYCMSAFSGNGVVAGNTMANRVMGTHDQFFHHVLLVHNGVTVTIENNEIDGCGTGQCILALTGANGVIRNNRVRAYHGEGTRLAIALSDGERGNSQQTNLGAHFSVIDNVIIGVGGNVDSAPDDPASYAFNVAALLAEGHSTMTAERNTVSGANLAIFVRTASTIDGTRNTISGVRAGITAVDAGSRVGLRFNDITGYRRAFDQSGHVGSDLTCNWWGGEPTNFSATQGATLHIPWANQSVAATGAGTCTGGLSTAGTRTWVGPIDGSGVWETAANWSGGVVPAAQDTAVIAASGSYSVTISSAVSVAKVVIGGGTGNQGLAVVGTGSLTIGDSVRVTPSGFLMLGGGGSGTVLTGGAVKVEGVLQWFEGAIVGPGAIEVVSGATVMFGGDQPKTLSQRSIVNAGNVLYTTTGNGHVTFTNGSTIVNQAGAEFLVQGDGDFLQGTGATSSISNAGFYRKMASGTPTTHTVGVVFTNTGVLEIQEGTVAFSGANATNAASGIISGIGTVDVNATAFSNAGTLAPGFSPGQLTFNGNVTLQETSAIGMQVGGLIPSTEHDLVSVSGAVVLSGRMEVSLINGFVPQVDQSIPVLTWTSVSGAFTEITGLNLGGGMFFEPVYTATGLNLVVRNAQATVTWVNTAGGNWSTAANWSTGVVPTSTDIVGITAAGASSYTVTLDVNTTIAGLIVGGESGSQVLSATGRTLTINGSSSVNPAGQLLLISSTLNGTGTFTNTGETTLRDAVVGASTTIHNAFFLALEGSTVINGPITTQLNDSWIRVQGLSAAGSANVSIANGFTNNGALDLSNGSTGGWGATLNILAGTLINSPNGDIRSLPGTSGGARTLAAVLDNRGNLEVDQALTINKAGADHLNSGVFDLNSASLTVTQSGTTPSFTNRGTIDLAGNGRTFTVSGGNLNVFEGTVFGPLGTRLVVTGAAVVNMLPTSVQIPVTLTSATVTGPVTLQSGQTLRLQDGALSVPVVIESGGTLLAMGDVALNGALTLNAGGLLRPDGNSTGGSAVLTVLNGFTNNGTIELTNTTTGGWGSRLNVTNGTLVNAGTLQVLAGSSSGARVLGAQLHNTGTLDVNLALTIDRASSAHVNDSPILLDGANLTVTQTGTAPSFTNNSTITLSGTNRTLTISGGHLDANQGSITGPLGTALVVTGGATVDLLPATVTVPLTLTSATVSGPVTVQNEETLRLLDGALNAPLTIESGGVVLGMGNVALNGALTLNAGGLLRPDGNSTGGTSFVTVLNGFTNNGTIELTNTSTGGWGSRIIVTNGSLTNAGTINVFPGASSGSRQISAQLVNNGTLNVDLALTIDRPSAAHVNNSTIILDGANLTVTQGGTAASFTNNGTIAMSGTNRTMTVSGGHLDLDQGSVTGGLGTGTLVVTGGATVDLLPTTVTSPITLTSATVNNAISLTSGQSLTLLDGALNAPISIGSGATLLGMGTVALNGTVTLGSGGLLRAEGNSTGGSAVVTALNGFTNEGAIELTNTTTGGWGSRLNVTNGTLLNAGTISSLAGTSGGSRILGAQLNNGANGFMTISQALTLDRPGSAHVNNNSLTLNANLTVTQTGTSPSFVNNSSITLSGSGRTLTVSGGHLDVNQGTITGPLGTQLIVTGGATVDLGVPNVQAPLTLTSATVNGSVTVGDNQTLRLLDGALNAPVTIAGGATGGTLIAMGTVALNGAVAIQLSTVSGLLRVDGNSTGGSAAVTVLNGFTNNGRIELTNSTSGGWGARLNVTNGTLTNAGTISALAGISGGTRALGAQLNNTGTLTVGQALTLDRPGSAHVNASTINLNTANLTVTQSGVEARFTNNGTIALSGSDRLLTFSGGRVVINQGLITGPLGTRVAVTNGATVDLGVPNVQAPLTLASALLSGPVTIGSDQTLTLQDGTLSAPISIGIAGTLRAMGRTRISGTVTQNGTIRVDGNSTGGSANLTVDNGFSNEGLIELTNTTVGGWASVLTVSIGTLTNTGRGTLQTSNGASGGTRAIIANVVNDGNMVTATSGVGTLGITGNFMQGLTGILHMELASGSSYDVLNVSGSATLGGALSVTFLNGFLPPSASGCVNVPIYTLMTFASRTGDFTQVNISGAWTTIPGTTTYAVCRHD